MARQPTSDEHHGAKTALNRPEEYVSLYFANTVNWHASDHQIEELKRYDDLVTWSQKEGLLDDHSAKLLLQEGKTRPGEAERVLKRGIVLREAIYHIFSAVTHGEKPRESDLQTLNSVLPEALSRLRVSTEGGQFIFDWTGTANTLDQMLWPIAKSAAELLVSRELAKVRECANEEEGCGWLFMDTTKNHSRRWCEMRSCGNRAKARRYYERSKAISV